MPTRPATFSAVLSVSLTLLLFAALPGTAIAGPSDTTLVSRASGANGAAAHNEDVAATTADSYEPTVTADGRFIAFASGADNLTSDDVDGVEDVFVRDTKTSVTTLVSRESGATGLGGDSDSWQPSISADGRYVAFSSNADNLSNDDNNNYLNVYVRDLTTNSTTLVSRESGATGLGGNVHSWEPSISADGHYVAFQSGADNLSNEDNDAVENVFVRDIQSATTRLVSRRESNGLGSDLNGSSENPIISEGGRYVAFGSYANNISSEDIDGGQLDVFVYDNQTNATSLVSRKSGISGDGGNSGSYTASMSDDGRYIAFSSYADNLSDNDNNFVANAFVRDTRLSTTTLISRANGVSGAGATGDSYSPSISNDGRHVAFSSDANDLSDDLEGIFNGIFVRDTQLNTTSLVSRASGASGAPASNASNDAAISGDGNVVAFASDANNLSGEDDNQVTNIFARDLRLPTPAPQRPAVVTDTTAPALTAKSKRNYNARALAKAKRVVLTVSCNEACSITGTASVAFSRKRARGKAKKKTTALATLSASVSANQPKELTFKLSKSLLKRIAKATKPLSKADRKAKTVHNVTDLPSQR